jgi:outer membrane protein TolC
LINQFLPKFILFLIYPVILTGIGGCITPDRWPVFTPEDSRLAGDNQFSGIDSVNQLQTRFEIMPELPTLPEKSTEKILDLSVEQAVMLALKNNQELKVEQFNPVIKGSFEDIERGIYDPELFGEVEYFKEKSSETARSTGTRFDVEGSDTTYQAGIRQFLPSGTNLEMTVGQNRSVSNRTPEQQVSRIGLSLVQSLLKGFGPGVNLAGVRQAELDTIASVHQLRGFTEALLAKAETAYWKYVLAKKEIDIFEQSLALAQKQRDEVEERITVGLYPEIEAAATRAEVALRKQALINARSLALDNRFKLLRLIYPKGMGLDCPLNATSELQVTPRYITNIRERLQLALKSRPDLEETRLLIHQNRLETMVTRNGLLPRLDLFIALGYSGYADSFSKSFHELDSDTYDFEVGFRLNHFLGNRAAKARDHAAKASVRQESAALSNLEQMVCIDVRLAVNEVERARQQITASTATRQLQEETLRAEQDRFAVGAGTSLLVAQAQRDLLASQISEVEAIVNYRIALTELYLAEGSLLERRGIRLFD